MKRPASENWLTRLLHWSAADTQTAEVAFPPDFLASLERLRLAALRALGGGLSEGHRLGAYKGGQLEFHGHRAYAPGDELRYIDWNSYARLGKPYVKEFAREEAGVLHLLLDATPSMLLGQPSKWTFARRIAALFWHVAQSSKDRVGIHVFRGTETVESFPQRGLRAGVEQAIAFLENAPAAQPSENNSANTGLDRAVTGFLRQKPTRGRVLIISDFWSEERDTISALSRLTAAGHDLSAIHVLAPEEVAPNLDGDLLAHSLEEPDDIQLSASAEWPSRYAQALEAHRRSLEAAVRRRGGQVLTVNSDTNIEQVLITILRERRWVV